MNLPSSAPQQTPIDEQLRWFAEEVQPHESSLRHYLRAQFPGVRDVDDLVQESFIRVWKAKAAHPIDSAKAFLFTVAQRLTFDHLRRQKISPFDSMGDLVGLSVVEERPGALETLARNEKIQLLGKAIGSLPPRCREVVRLHKIHGLPHREVAARLGLSESTVKNQITIGVKRCEDYLRKRGIDRF